MMASALWLLADAATTTKFEWGRIQADYEWWMYGGILLALLAPLFWIYRGTRASCPGISASGCRCCGRW